MKKYFIGTYRLPFSWQDTLGDKTPYEAYQYFNGIYDESGILVAERNYPEFCRILKLRRRGERPSAIDNIMEADVIASTFTAVS